MRVSSPKKKIKLASRSFSWGQTFEVLCSIYFMKLLYFFMCFDIYLNLCNANILLDLVALTPFDTRQVKYAFIIEFTINCPPTDVYFKLCNTVIQLSPFLCSLTL